MIGKTNRKKSHILMVKKLINLFIVLLFSLGSCNQKQNNIENAGFIKTETINYLSKNIVNNTKFDFNIHNNPLNLNESDSLIVFLNNYCVLKNTFKEVYEINIDTLLYDTEVIPTVYIKNKLNKYWFIKSDYSFYFNRPKHKSEKIINLIFTVNSFRKEPYVIFNGLVR